MKKKLFFLIIFILIFLFGCSKQIGFNDKNLNEFINKEFKDSNDNYDDIKYLDISSLNIENINGIEKFKNLETLIMSNNSVEDISPLKDLNIKFLDVQNNNISDLSPLYEMKSLDNLYISNNIISNDDYLDKLNFINKSDIYLEVNDDNEETLDFIKKTKNINRRVSYFDFDDILVLDTRKFNSFNCDILSYFINLEELYLGTNSFNYDAIKSVKSLKKIVMSDIELEDINFLSDLNNLTYLDISNNKISDIEPIKNLINLKELYIRNNYISDYKVIDEILSSTDVNDVSIAYFNDEILKENISKILNVNNYIPESVIEEVKELDLSNLGIVDITGIEIFENLVSINLSNNYITDISNLEKLDSLYEIDLSYNNISEINPLLYLSKIKILNLRANNIEIIEPLVHIESLEYLDIRDNNFYDSDNIKILSNKLKTFDY